MARRTMTIGLQGMTELMADLDRLRGLPVGQEAKQALMEGAEIIRMEAMLNAPVAPRATWYRGRLIQPGGLKRSLKAAMGRQYKTFLQAFVFTLAAFAPHAHLVEFGTKAHRIKATKKALRWFSRFRNGFKYAPAVNHPGAKANPFFRNAIKSKRSTVKRRIEAVLKRAIEDVARVKRAA